MSVAGTVSPCLALLIFFLNFDKATTEHSRFKLDYYKLPVAPKFSVPLTKEGEDTLANYSKPLQDLIVAF